MPPASRPSPRPRSSPADVPRGTRVALSPHEATLPIDPTMRVGEGAEELPTAELLRAISGELVPNPPMPIRVGRRSSWTAGPGFLPFFSRFFQNADHQSLFLSKDQTRTGVCHVAREQSCRQLHSDRSEAGFGSEPRALTHLGGF